MMVYLGFTAVSVIEFEHVSRNNAHFYTGFHITERQRNRSLEFLGV